MGRPKREINIKSLARGYTPVVIKTLGGLAVAAESEAVRVSACSILLDRGWGKAAQPLTGRDGVEDITVTIRTIIETKK